MVSPNFSRENIFKNQNISVPGFRKIYDVCMYCPETYGSNNLKKKTDIYMLQKSVGHLFVWTTLNFNSQYVFKHFKISRYNVNTRRTAFTILWVFIV
jgi:hypothetical protein